MSDAPHQPQRQRRIVSLAINLLYQLISKNRSAGSRRGDLFPISVHLIHQAGEVRKLIVQLLAGIRIDFFQQIAEYDDSRFVPRWIAGASSRITTRLTPAILRTR